MMPTDEERRSVAARLRAMTEGQSPMAEYPVEMLFIAFGMPMSRDIDGALIGQIADLIDPADATPGALCAHCEKLSWCGCIQGDLEGGCDFEPSVEEGEPPYNLYSLYEAVLHRRPRDEFAIEDDEVEELMRTLLDICNCPERKYIELAHDGGEE
ncbi:hypothetical protein [uncultured Enorma sp.]|uniref:hypothetical protein n=1 Tax=uncultured Enorma sp. TaxID=1714346 RepID=UPI00265F4C17|nr:hypothetical protein [uncultured Enorma sp.]